MDGRWVSEDEGYRARGYVQFEDDWMTPAEHDRVLRERAFEENQERQRQADQQVRDAEQRAAEAEERARQAEERARQAEADAASASTDGLPLWYGWGAGPVYWPTGPIVSQPIRNPPSTRPARVPR